VADDAKSDRGRRSGRRDTRGPDTGSDADPHGFDPRPAARDYLSKVLDGLGLRARVAAHYDGRRLQVDVAGPGVERLIGARNAGARTELLESFQTLVGRAAFGDRAGTKVVTVDVDGFRNGRVAQLEAAGRRLAAFVKATGRTVHLPATNSFDRYAFHNTTGKVGGVWSESEGNGVFRMLAIKPRKSNDRPDGDRPERAPRPERPAEKAAPEAAPVVAEEVVAEVVEAAPAPAPAKPRAAAKSRSAAKPRSEAKAPAPASPPAAEPAVEADAPAEGGERRRRRRTSRTTKLE
jgi:spoIIIJ-associated protein